MCERSLYDVIFDHIFLFFLYLESNAAFVEASSLVDLLLWGWSCTNKCQCVLLECGVSALRSLFTPAAQCGGIHFPTCWNLYEPGRRCVEAERERLTERVGWGEPGHRWRQHADVPAELLGEVPANVETVTEVLWASGPPLNGWRDLRKQMLKNASDSAEMSQEVQQCGRKWQPSWELGQKFLNSSKQFHGMGEKHQNWLLWLILLYCDQGCTSIKTRQHFSFDSPTNKLGLGMQMHAVSFVTLLLNYFFLIYFDWHLTLLSAAVLPQCYCF